MAPVGLVLRRPPPVTGSVLHTTMDWSRLQGQSVDDSSSEPTNQEAALLDPCQLDHAWLRGLRRANGFKTPQAHAACPPKIQRTEGGKERYLEKHGQSS
ncbi:hypothetical protein VTO42DRAFT_3760 [Malbranchea cinnamomea]